MASLDAISVELAQQPQLWWGYTVEHGWIVMDRDDARNEGESRHVVRCRDWIQLEVSRRDFGSDHFKGFKSFIDPLPEAQVKEACTQLLAYRREFLSRATGFRVTKAELERRQRQAEREAIIEAHRRFLEQRSLPAQQVRLPSGRVRRVTHCYHCKHHLDSAVDVECAACGWIVCRCGACGCGYSARGEDVGL
jgi:hypothetical protein